MNLSGGDMLMRALREEGVKFIFGYPGGAALHIYDSVFRQKSIEHILVRHEQGATHAADGYARALSIVRAPIISPLITCLLYTSDAADDA